MTTPETALQAQHTAKRGLLVAFELGLRQWRLAMGDGAHSPSRFTIDAGDLEQLHRCIAKAKERFGLAADAPVHSCYEAGRDGWWLHRALQALGIDNIVVDSSSIEVNRRQRRSKNDRLDADKLLSMLQRFHGGELRVWSVVRAPSVEQEDARRLHRELQTLGREQTQHTNRIGSLLALMGLQVRSIGGRNWERWWGDHASQLPPELCAQIERENARLALVRAQLRQLEREQRSRQADEQRRNPMVAQLARLRCIGLRSAWTFAHELFWRHFDNRRQVAACLGITPTPYDSGQLEREQGISKAGNKRLRTLMVQLSWMWLRLQPGSELTLWFNERFAGGKRSRRIGIVALARRLAIALWRYVEFGQIPAGATLKAAA